MRWSKIKNIIILLLVIVNLFLLGLVGARAWRTAENSRLARARMVEVLSHSGIAFLPQEVPDQISLPPLRLKAGAEAPDREALQALRDGEAEDLRHSEDWELLSAQGEPITASTALIRLLEAMNKGGYVCSQVTDMYPGYAANGTGTVTLTPVWYVETDTYRFAVDAYTGAVTAEER